MLTAEFWTAEPVQDHHRPLDPRLLQLQECAQRGIVRLALVYPLKDLCGVSRSLQNHAACEQGEREGARVSHLVVAALAPDVNLLEAELPQFYELLDRLSSHIPWQAVATYLGTSIESKHTNEHAEVRRRGKESAD